jgi:hypothetical protein
MMIRVINKIKNIRLHRNTVTFPSDARISTTASTNVFCSILHLYSGLLKSGFGHYMERKKKKEKKKRKEDLSESETSGTLKSSN